MDRGRKTHLKLRILQEKEMSEQGYKNWSPHLRATVHKKVYQPVMFTQVPVEEINSISAVQLFAKRHLWNGRFIIMGYSHGKTKTHVKLVSLCKVSLKLTDDERWFARVTNAGRLSRYWFWNKNA